MYVCRDSTTKERKDEKIEDDIINKLVGFVHKEQLKEVDYFIENNLYIQAGKKDLLETLSYTKYNLKEYLVSFYYGIESFSYNQNSVGIMYSLLSLMQLRLYEQAEYIFKKNEEQIIDTINSNKFEINEFIDILI